MPKSARTAKPFVDINILYPQGIPQKLPIKFLKWLLSYGKFIAIIVEVVVIATFVVRFSLDAERNNLKDQITTQIPYINGYSAEEAQIRQTQFKISEVKKVYGNEPSWTQILNQLSAQVPIQGVKLTGILLDHSQPGSLTVKISGQASNSNDLAVLVTGLKQSQEFRNVTLSNISLEQDQVVFTISANH